MSGYAARGTILFNGQTLVKESGFTKGGCASLMNAKKNVVKALANALRHRVEQSEIWTEWRDLPWAEREEWSRRVALSLHWDELHGGTEARLTDSNHVRFRNAMNSALK